MDHETLDQNHSKSIRNKKKKPILQRVFQWSAATAAAFSLLVAAAGGAAWMLSPNSLTVTENAGLELPAGWYQVSSAKKQGESPVSAAGQGAGQSTGAEIRLLGLIPVKEVRVEQAEQPYGAVCGVPFGIKMEADSVVVVGTADISSNGKSINPASEAGIQVGDVIYEAGGKKVTENDELAKIFESSGGKPVTICAQRGGKEFTTSLTPVFSQIDGLYKGGLWVRDSTAGIGTLTFYDPKTKRFGGLGHGICDVDTNELMPLGTGEILPVTISGVVRGQRGAAGELQGYFSSDVPIGEMSANTETGVYGTLSQEPPVQQTLPIAMKQEVRAGKAQILTTVDGESPAYYDVEIESVNYDEGRITKNLILKVTDEKLLKKTGGIVQGLSGSPIIQNGKLVGAVTHVLVNNPEKGYGIFAETMWKAANSG